MEDNIKGIIRVDIGLLEPNSWNVNRNDDIEKLRESIQLTKGKYLDDNPIEVIALENGKYLIHDGEHRWKVAKELGFKEIPNITKEEKEKYNRWADKIMEKSFQLNAITAMRLEEDPLGSKARDFVDYLYHICETRKWNITDFGTPKYEEPPNKGVRVRAPAEFDILNNLKEERVQRREENIDESWMEATKEYDTEIDTLRSKIHGLEMRIEGITREYDMKLDNMRVDAYNIYIDLLKENGISEDLLEDATWEEMIKDSYIKLALGFIRTRERVIKILDIKQKRLIKELEECDGIDPLKKPLEIIEKKQERLDDVVKDYTRILEEIRTDVYDDIHELIEETVEYKNLEFKYEDIKKELEKRLEDLE